MASSTAEKKLNDGEGASAHNVEHASTTSTTAVLPPGRETLSYGRTGITSLFDSRFVLGAALLASMGGFSFGYDQGVIPVINVMPQFHAAFPEAATPFGKGFMTGMLELRAFVGCLFMPALANKISRKRAIMSLLSSSTWVL